MTNRLLGHLNNNFILVEKWFEFRKNLTTKQATCKLHDEIANAVND